jgi:hypothetical protein
MFDGGAHGGAMSGPRRDAARARLARSQQRKQKIRRSDGQESLAGTKSLDLLIS